MLSFKLGWQESSEYVANVVSKYRKAIDEVLQVVIILLPKKSLEMEQSFSRGFTQLA
ncbi:U32 family peptidase [Anaerobacillus sp. HL2]|nr:U32 family peptidase [Anaerobacillus sp. HL2]